MNNFRKYYPNVWVAECDNQYEKREIIELETKYGKKVECEVYNFLGMLNDRYLYSIVRLDENYAERKSKKYSDAAEKNQKKSQEKFKAAEEGREFLVLGEPIKVGHHSEKGHRALLERNQKRTEQAFEFSDKAEEQKRKAEYWEKKSKEITLAMPESLEYFSEKLIKAIEFHKMLKDNPEKRGHSYSLTYARNDMNDLKKKVQVAEKLWG